MGKQSHIELALGSPALSKNCDDPSKKDVPPALIQPDVSLVFANEEEPPDDPGPKSDPQPYVRQIVWINVLKLVALHLGGLAGLLLAPFAHPATIFFMFFLAFLTLLGVQVGAHRLWAHRSYKANGPVRVFLCLCHTMSMQNDLYEWVRDHRVHHKWSDTDADPHNAGRGFFFSHIGWLMVKKHPELLRKGATLDLSDLTDDPVVMFQRKYIVFLVAIFWALIPTLVPLLWDEVLLLSFLVCVVMRYTLTLHVTWLVNSWAHLWGNRPYNKSLFPVEASIRHVLVGEGFHNYHHAFPWDYSASELGPLDVFNPATAIINLLAKIGWAWDLKKPDASLVERTIATSGDRKQLIRRSGFFWFLWEWTSGLLTMTFPIWGLLLWKYGFLYLFYYHFFDKLPSLDVVSLYGAFSQLVEQIYSRLVMGA